VLLHLRPHAEHLRNPFWGKDRFRRAFCLEHAVGHEQQVIGVPGRKFEVVPHREDRPPIVHLRPHLLHKRKLVVHVEVGRGLVQQ